MPATPTLQRTLKPIHLWSIAVGLVISGEYFGWNYGWGVAGTVGFLIATLVITVMYVTFVFSYTELTAAIPHAGGAFAYAYRALGPWGALIAGYATLIDLLLATPAIAFALGSYLHFLYADIPVVGSALFFNAVFIVINIRGVKASAAFSVVITMLAVAELLVYMGVIAPHFKAANFMTDPMPYGWSGVFAALPYAIWFYLAIEGVAMVAEEVTDPVRNIPKGYISGLLTLALLALGVMVLTGGVTNWHRLSQLDHPLPEALSVVLGKGSSITKLFASIGLFGLVASFHGTILASSRQVFAMARSGYLPRALSAVGQRTRTPHWALMASGCVSAVALLTGTTSQVIVLSVFGAVTMYGLCMVSLLVLRKKEPRLQRPFRAPLYPYFPVVALLLSAVCLVAMVKYDLMLSLIFFAGMLIVSLVFLITGKYRSAVVEDELSADAEDQHRTQ
ncbi:ethanolamine permease [Mucilaginibacter daejeonensis]|uniref:ethanolamine permease n=1 Tax=Mucilaginibacter daejeonensis TaxID=398049 RepID=UPI001D177189|nr:ethanolamine permease [Mucilaginibacter daejeonensis]UEG54658.1 ethanolamine permease [Mucilaginibacter daejeonensis]